MTIVLESSGVYREWPRTGDTEQELRTQSKNWEQEPGTHASSRGEVHRLGTSMLSYCGWTVLKRGSP